MRTYKIIILLSYISVASFSAAIITPALPTIEQQYHLGHGALEWVVTTFIIGYALGQLLYGPLANRFGRLVAIRSGFIVNLLGIGLCLLAAHAHSYSGLLAGRLLAALGGAAGLSCTFMLIGALLDSKQAKVAVSYSVLSFTSAVGIAIYVGGLVTQYWHWYDCFWVLMAHGIFVLVSTWLYREPAFEKQTINVASIVKQYRQAFANDVLLRFAALVGICTVVNYCYSAAAPLIAHQRLHMSPAEYGAWGVLAMAGMLVGGLTIPTLMKHFRPIHIINTSLVLLALVLLALAGFAWLHWLNKVSFFILAALLFCFASWIFPSASHYAANSMPDRASASSTMSFINMFSAVIGVAVMGYLPLVPFWSLLVIVSGFIVLVLIFNACIKTTVISD